MPNSSAGMWLIQKGALFLEQRFGVLFITFRQSSKTTRFSLGGGAWATTRGNRNRLKYFGAITISPYCSPGTPPTLDYWEGVPGTQQGETAIV